MDAKPAKPSDPRPLDERLHDELIDAVDEELELEIDDSWLAGLLEHTGTSPRPRPSIATSISRSCCGCRRNSSNFRTGWSIKSSS